MLIVVVGQESCLELQGYSTIKDWAKKINNKRLPGIPELSKYT